LLPFFAFIYLIILTTSRLLLLLSVFFSISAIASTITLNDVEHLWQGSESMGSHYLLSNVALAMLKRDDLQNEANGLLIGFMSTIGLCFVHREP
jgi:hypothetical protein